MPSPDERVSKRAQRCREYYELLISPLRELARAHGYALAVHGSLARDIDLLAVPWTDDAQPAEILIDAIFQALHGLVENTAFLSYCNDPQPAEKPHGRRAWTIMLCFEGVYLDISVMPLKEV